MREYLGKTVDVIVDRPLGSPHPEYGIIYPVNYGYIPGTISGDGKKIDAYILGEYKPVKEFRGRVIAAIERKNDNESKLVVAKTPNSYFEEEIKALTEFQERFFEIEIICHTAKVEKPCIRVTVLGFAKRGDGILVFEGYDAIKDEVFYRFPGGGVEFRRKSRVALQREFKEEINANILDMKYLCTIENIFTFEGIDKHEI